MTELDDTLPVEDWPPEATQHVASNAEMSNATRNTRLGQALGWRGGTAERPAFRSRYRPGG